MEKMLLRVLGCGSWVGLIVAANYGIPAKETESVIMVNSLWAAVSVIVLMQPMIECLAETLWGLGVLTVLVLGFWGIVAVAVTTEKNEYLMTLIPVGAAILRICNVRYSPSGHSDGA